MSCINKAALPNYTALLLISIKKHYGDVCIPYFCNCGSVNSPKLQLMVLLPKKTKAKRTSINLLHESQLRYRFIKYWWFRLRNVRNAIRESVVQTTEDAHRLYRSLWWSLGLRSLPPVSGQRRKKSPHPPDLLWHLDGKKENVSLLISA